MTRQPSLWWMDAAGIGVCLLASAVGYVTLVRPFLEKRSAAAALVREVEIRQKAVAGLESAAEAARDRVTMAREQLTAGAGARVGCAHQQAHGRCDGVFLQLRSARG